MKRFLNGHVAAKRKNSLKWRLEACERLDKTLSFVVQILRSKSLKRGPDAGVQPHLQKIGRIPLDSSTHVRGNCFVYKPTVIIQKVIAET